MNSNSITNIKLPAANSPASAGDQSLPQTAGLRLEFSGQPGAVIAQGWLIDEGIGFSAPFTPQHKSACNCVGNAQHQYGTGIMIGDGE